MNASTTDLAYMAGVMDSDGYIGIHRNTYGMRVRGDCTQATYQARVQLKQVDTEAVDLFHATFAGHRFYQAATSTKGRRLWTWQVHSASCRPILEALLPYLRIKHPRAVNALEACRLNSLPKRFTVPAVVEGEPLISVTEAALRLGKSRAVVVQAVRKGSVPSVRLDRTRASEPAYFIPESFLAVWAGRSHTPRRSPEVTAQLEACFLRSKQLNRVGI